MRTTLTLDPDVVRMIEEETHRQRKSFKEVVNDAIRRGLSSGGRGAGTRRFKIKPMHLKLRPGLDRTSLNRLVDELEDESAARKLRSRK
jgi:hypothetical protein